MNCTSPELLALDFLRMIWLLVIFFIPGVLNEAWNLGSAATINPCSNTTAVYEEPQPLKKKQYNLEIDLPNGTKFLTLKFDSEASLVLKEPDPKKVDVAFAKLSVPRTVFQMVLPTDEKPKFNAQVFGPASGYILPYIESIRANGEEICENPGGGYFNPYITEGEETNTGENLLDKSCGRRKVTHTELIYHGQPTKSGDWPWHVAISRIEKSSLDYICGGTLLSKTLVLTGTVILSAAHCVTKRGAPVVPGLMTVYLGKHNLIGGDVASQEREVFEVTINPKFNPKTLNNDIALLRLKSEAVFTDYVQPACLWNPDIKLPVGEVFGTVVGWGFNHQDSLSTTLQQITIPIVSELQCLKSNPIFFHKKLDTNKFCAGFANGTSVCNGDSGGGLMIFVPDTPGDTSQASGSWYVRGIVSLTLSRPNTNVCDPEQFTIFTDVQHYRDWVLKYLD